mgnify:CR=1 FL=1
MSINDYYVSMDLASVALAAVAHKLSEIGYELDESSFEDAWDTLAVTLQDLEVVEV